jgi:glycerophosphoryl diester phosphodiesterase
MQIWTHRGNPGVENTLEAFSQAWSNGITHFETDIHCTKDNVLVLAHDPDISRLTGQSYRINELDLEQLQNFKIKQTSPWATLEDLYQNFPEAFISIDIKSDDALQPLIAWAQDKDLSNLVVGSFSTHRTLAFRKAFPLARTALTTREIMLINLGLSFLLRNLPSSLFAMVPVKFRGIKIYTSRFRKFCASRGIEIHIWTINNPAVAKNLKSLGASGIVTDDYLAFLTA